MSLTIVDDFTRATWVYLLKHKNDCVNAMKDLMAYMENQFLSKVRVVRSDNAK